MSQPTLNVLRIIDGTTVDGPHFRTSIYLAGCDHHCPGCQNPQSWDHNGGTPMTIEAIMAEVCENDMDVTITGGDPMLSPDRLLPLLKALKLNGRNVWLFTGYTFERLQADPVRSPLLPYIDVIVDGPFIESQRDTSLLFRGSANQRLIDVQPSLLTGEVRLWTDNF